MTLIGKLCPKIGSSKAVPVRTDGLVFIKKEPISVPSKTGPTIVEFWASWCGPCTQAFPHMSELQKKYAFTGLQVVGISLEDDTPQTRQFVAKQGDSMDNWVAVDASGTARRALMDAAGVSGIPHAFVIDAKGIVQHHGHPMLPRFDSVVLAVCVKAVSEPAEKPEPAAEMRGREELAALPVRELKKIMDDRGIGYSDLSEKGELVDRIVATCR